MSDDYVKIIICLRHGSPHHSTPSAHLLDWSRQSKLFFSGPQTDSPNWIACFDPTMIQPSLRWPQDLRDENQNRSLKVRFVIVCLVVVEVLFVYFLTDHPSYFLRPYELKDFWQCWRTLIKIVNTLDIVLRFSWTIRFVVKVFFCWFFHAVVELFVALSIKLIHLSLD